MGTIVRLITYLGTGFVVVSSLLGCGGSGDANRNAAVAVNKGPANGPTSDRYLIESLNSPDPLFVTTGSSVSVRVTVPAEPAFGGSVRLNGLDVTESLSASAPGQLTGTVPGLVAGINTLEVFKTPNDPNVRARLRVAKAVSPGRACSMEAFANVSLPVSNTVITAVTHVAATSSVPAHCFITGTVNAGRVGYESSPGAPVSRYTYTINWQARLPDAWNSKFYMPGGGGTDGSVPGTTTRLRQGYAAAANDSGHSNGANSDPLAGGSASFGTDYLARVDFAYNAIDVTTQTGKRLADLYYGATPQYSYFEGCSMGGREAMMVTQRLPSYFNGSLVGDPAFRITKVGVWAAYEGQQLAKLART